MNKVSVFLDVDDTILDFHKAEVKAVSETFRRMGIDPTEETVSRYSVINQHRWELLEQGKISRGEVMTSRFDLLFEELGIERSGVEAQSIYEKLLPIGHFFMPDAPELLKALYGKYDLYIVSNGAAETQASRLESAGIIPYFEEIFISEAVGFEKPTREFFDHCFSHIQSFRPEDAIIVGETCWYNPKGKKPRDDIKPDYEIKALMELPELLKKIF